MKGVYALIIAVPNPIKVRIGALGENSFAEGFYVYVGSARGKSTSLENRLHRHFSKNKTVHWHIDDLLDASVTISEAIYSESDNQLECLIAKALAYHREAHWGPKKFGASDCKSGCESHLIHFGPSIDVIRVVSETFTDLGLCPSLYTNTLQKPSD